MAALEELGKPIPESILNPPELKDEYRVFWTAFMDLLSEPRGQNGMIPWTAIRQYSNDIRIPVDDLKAVVWTLDRQLRAWWKANPQQAET